jgi:tetratricopeptide (TPR) repeat protein
LLDEIVRTRPDFRVAYLNAAAILLEKGRPDEALVWLDRAAARGMTDSQFAERRGAALLAASRPADAAAALRPLAAAADADVDVLNTAAVACSESGHAEEARRLFQRALAADSSSAEVWHNLGLLELSSGNRSAAARAFEAAVTHAPDYAEAWRAPWCDARRHRPRGGRACVDARARARSRDLDTLHNAGMLLVSGRLDAKRSLLDRFVAEAGERDAADRARVQATLAKDSRSTLSR